MNPDPDQSLRVRLSALRNIHVGNSDTIMPVICTIEKYLRIVAVNRQQEFSDRLE